MTRSSTDPLPKPRRWWTGSNLPEFVVLANAEEVAESAAADIAEALRDGGRTLVLTGGTSPIRCYQLLAELDVDWGRVTVLLKYSGSMFICPAKAKPDLVAESASGRPRCS